MLKTFYEKTESNSKSQFEHDFGCYPPKPLQATEPSTRFSVIQLSKFGSVLHKISILYKLQTRSPEAMNEYFRKSTTVKELQESNKQLTDSLQTVKKKLKSLNPTEKTAALLLLILTSPAMILALTACFSYYLCKLTLAAFREKEVRGSFLPVINNDLEIIISGNRKNKNQIDAVKSHEHLHLVQYTHRMTSGEKDRIKLSNPLEILTQESAKNSYINYIFERDEAEARLHEFVLSFYRNHNSLPLDLEGFIRLISTSRKLNPLISKVLFDTASAPQKNKTTLETYQIRDAQTETDIAIAILSIKSTDLQKKFILEVLTVMYGNLLGYYGDQFAKKNFLAEIKRPNLYDSLWV